MLSGSFSPLDSHYSFVEMLQLGIALVILVAGIVSVLYSIWGGFLLITSGGNEEKVKPAVNHIRHAFLGLIVLILIIFIAPRALALFGLPYAEEINPTKIFQKMRDLSATFFA